MKPFFIRGIVRPRHHHHPAAAVVTIAVTGRHLASLAVSSCVPRMLCAANVLLVSQPSSQPLSSWLQVRDVSQCCRSLLIACVTPGGSIPMASAQQEPRLPCQRCLRRLSRPADLDLDERLSCDKQVGHLLCGYCNKGRKPCLSVGLRVLLSAWFLHGG
jgi:hypothetical protein